MTTAIKCAISPFAQPKKEVNANAIRVLGEKLAAVPASDIPEGFRKLSRFFRVIVLVPKSAVHGETGPKQLGPNKSVSGLAGTGNVRVPVDAAMGWLSDSSHPDRFEFGGVTGCFSTMQVHRNGQPVTLTSQEFKTLAYLIKNPLRVISRGELLNQVWGYANYPTTRTVDNRILKLRKKLETEPARPKHFHTVHGAGYKFLP